MVDLEELRRYDEAWQKPLPRYETCRVPWGWWARATVIAPFDECPSVVDAEVEDRAVVVLGAGPSGMLMAAYLANAGHAVVLIERQPRLFCGSTWNLARDEFAELARTPPLTPDEWRSCITGAFEQGVFRLHDPDQGGVERDFYFAECLNVSLDEGRFYTLLGRAQPNLDVRTGTTAELVALRREGAYIRWEGPAPNGSAREGSLRSGLIRAQLLIDARGWRSPLALAVHPSRRVESVYNMLGVVTDVGVSWGAGAGGRAKYDAAGSTLEDSLGRPLGIICATYHNAIELDGVLAQGIVERFTDYVPGSAEHDGRGDVLYYFTRSEKPARLSDMAERLLPALQDVAPDLDGTHVRKLLYGHCPGYHAPGPFSRWRVQTSAGDRLLLVGVAAQQYSGLTGCSFGTLARNAARLGREIDAALRRHDLGFAALAGIDIDPRERNSQAISGLFGGTMAVIGPDEDRFSPNRDWLIFCEAARKARLDPQLMGEALKDKIRFETLNKILAMLRLDPRVGEVMLRNNKGNELLAAWIAARGYLRLLAEELVRWWKTGDNKYKKGVGAALVNLPGVALSGSVLATRAALRVARRARSRGRAP